MFQICVVFCFASVCQDAWHYAEEAVAFAVLAFQFGACLWWVGVAGAIAAGSAAVLGRSCGGDVDLRGSVTCCGCLACFLCCFVVLCRGTLCTFHVFGLLWGSCFFLPLWGLFLRRIIWALAIPVDLVPGPPPQVSGGRSLGGLGQL